MNQQRRTLLKTSGAAGVIAVSAAAGMIGSSNTLAAEWNKAAFGASNSADVLKGIDATTAISSKDIFIKAPDIAENGSVVPIEVTSNIAGTQSIAILVDRNPFPLAASFDIANGAEAYVGMRLKVAGKKKDEDPWPILKVVVKAGGKTYTASRELKVTLGGCGG